MTFFLALTLALKAKAIGILAIALQFASQILLTSLAAGCPPSTPTLPRPLVGWGAPPHSIPLRQSVYTLPFDASSSPNSPTECTQAAAQH